jgi:hypothetical protein
MHKFVLLKNVSFNFSNSLNDLTNNKIEEYLKDKVEFYSFNNSKELFTSIHEILGNGIYENINCYYDNSVLIQAIFFEDNINENYTKLLLVKRKIHDNDTYTFLEFDPSSDTDIYQYDSITPNDIINIIMEKNLNRGIYVHSDKKIDEIVYFDKTESDQIGTLTINHNGVSKELKYLNLVNLIKELSEKNISETQFTEILQKKLDESGVEYLYTQKDFGLGLLNCYYQIIGFAKNEIVSNLINEDISGDVIIGLENKLNDDSRLLGLTSETFKQIIKLSKNNKFKVKNEIFCNIYYELSHL